MSGYVSGPASCPPSICADVSAYWNICCLLLTDHLLAELMKCSRCWDNPALDCQWHRKHFPLRFHFYLCSGMAAPLRYGLPHPCLLPRLAGGAQSKFKLRGLGRMFLHSAVELTCPWETVGVRGSDVGAGALSDGSPGSVMVRKFVRWDCSWHRAESLTAPKTCKATEGVLEPSKRQEMGNSSLG